MFEESGEVITQILNFQRLIAFITFAVFDECTDPSEAILFKHVPHKFRRRQGRELRDCWRTRFALEVLNNESRLMYAYLVLRVF